MKIKKWHILFFLVFLQSISSFASTQKKADSLEILIKSLKDDSIKVNYIIQLAQIYEKENPEQALIQATIARNTADKISYLKGKIQAMQLIAKFYVLKGRYDDGIALINSSKSLADNSKNPTILFNTYILKADLEFMMNKADAATSTFETAMNLAQKMNDASKIIFVNNKLGELNFKLANNEKALEYYLAALKIADKHKDSIGLASSSANLSKIYLAFENYNDAEYYLNTAFKINNKIQNYDGISLNYRAFGDYFTAKNDLNKALPNYEKALEYREQYLDYDPYQSAIDYNNIGNIFKLKGDYKSAVDYYIFALSIRQSIKDSNGLSILYNDIAALYLKTNEPKETINYCLESTKLLNNNEVTSLHAEVYKNLAIAYGLTGNYKLAFESHVKFADYTEKLNNNNKAKAISEALTKFGTEKKEKENELLRERAKLNDMYLATQQKQKYFLYSAIALLIFVAILLYLRFINKKKSSDLLQKQKDEIEIANENISRQNLELESLNDDLMVQKNLIESAHLEIIEKNEEIISSIRYAEKIQKAILPQVKKVKEILPDAFVLFKPKDIIAGDFYWITQKDDLIYVAVVDCTGHGVPGSMLSMIGTMTLNESMQKGFTKPSEFLNQLNKTVISSLNQQIDSENENQDGMDAAILIIDKKNKNITFSGAKRSVVYIYDGILNEVKGDSLSVGGKQRITQLSYTDFDIEYKEGTKFYLFSDGYADQSNIKSKKIGSKKLKEKLLEIHKLSCDIQENELNHLLETHKGNEAQRDDITVVGFSI